MLDLTGQTLNNRYRVDTFIDRGGMPDVYRGFEKQRQITVALKFMRSDFAEEHEFERRFRKEAHALDHVDHPSIVHFYELVRAEETCSWSWNSWMVWAAHRRDARPENGIGL
jgi:serine/threonine protein kinase